MYDHFGEYRAINFITKGIFHKNICFVGDYRWILF